MLDHCPGFTKPDLVKTTCFNFRKYREGLLAILFPGGEKNFILQNIIVTLNHYFLFSETGESNWSDSMQRSRDRVVV